MAITATIFPGSIVLFDGTTRVTLKVREGPFNELDVASLASQCNHVVEGMTVETFTQPLGATNPDDGLEDLNT